MKEEPEKKVIKDLVIVVFEINKHLIQEAIDFYHIKNINFAKFFEETPAEKGELGLCNINYDPLNIVPNNM